MSEELSFERDIRPLFRDKDRESMESSFDLWDYDDVKEYSTPILEQVKAGNMPCDEAWPAERVALLQRWIDAGMPA
jgi:hypothetical protein